MTQRSRPRAITSRRPLMWARWQVAEQAVGTGSEVAFNLLSSYESDYSRNVAEVTVTRILGSISVSSSGVDSLTQSMVGVGIIIVGQAAFDVGVSALPFPLIENHADWMYMGVVFCSNHKHESSATPTFTNEGSSRDFDVKGQRKLHEQEEVLCLSIRNSSSSAGAIRVRGFGSILLKGR